MTTQSTAHAAERPNASSERNGNLPAFKEMQGKVQTLCKLCSSPGVQAKDCILYINNIQPTVQCWFSMVPAVAGNDQAFEMVSDFKKVMDEILNTHPDHSFPFSVKEVQSSTAPLPTFFLARGRRILAPKMPQPVL